MLKAMLKPAVSPDASAAYPSRIADTIWARLWLAEGFPVADVLTMLEVRRRFEFSPHFARTYAVEILSASRTEIQLANQPRITHRKEPHQAVA